MQMLYKSEEDRVLFRVNSIDGSEFKFWITRRFAILMLRVLEQHMLSDQDVSTQGTQEARKALQSFKEEQARRERQLQRRLSGGCRPVPAWPGWTVGLSVNVQHQR